MPFKKGHKINLGKHWKKEPLTQEHKDKLSKSHIGKKHSQETKNKIGYGNGIIKGWVTPINKLIRSLTRYNVWRILVFTRDKFTCQECGQVRGKIEADHIKPLSFIINKNRIKNIDDAINCDEIWDIKNGRTLCRNCHKKTGTYAERAKNFKEDLND